MHFSKYQGSGNDFIVIDDRECRFPVRDSQYIQRLCLRSLGIGADGLIVLQHSSSADFRMRIFNADGKEAAMCGNGLRCLVLYLRDLGFTQEVFAIETEKGVLSCTFKEGKIVTIFPNPKIVHWGLELAGIPLELFVVDTGVPHAVAFIKDVKNAPLKELGPAVRFHPYFAPAGVNVNLVELTPGGVLAIRTYERGVEAETLSCGTGMAAAGLVFSRLFSPSRQIRLRPQSQDLIEIEVQEEEIALSGPAAFVFRGEIP